MFFRHFYIKCHLGNFLINLIYLRVQPKERKVNSKKNDIAKIISINLTKISQDNIRKVEGENKRLDKMNLKYGKLEKNRRRE